MLAASYGVSMAFWAAPRAARFQQRLLPNYARALFALMFGQQAQHSTTHILARDYALRSIELALKIQPQLLNPTERLLTTPLFTIGGIRNWDEVEDKDDEKYRLGDSPLGMDFGNYTLGRLVSGRSAYDNKHLDYQRVRRQIMWRIYDLGYRLGTFSAIDQEIARFAYDRGNNPGKTDRYGKKYAWIAFYELAGYRQDLGLLPYDEKRISDADIDPSFPVKPSSPTYFTESWILHDGSVAEWLHSGSCPDVENRLIVQEFAGVPGPWVILHGLVDQSTGDKTIFTFFRAYSLHRLMCLLRLKFSLRSNIPGTMRYRNRKMSITLTPARILGAKLGAIVYLQHQSGRRATR
jgi:hypothetical protein